MAEVLFEEVGPNGNLQAVVESDGDVCYFYLFGASDTDFGMKSVWIRNHAAAPESLDVERMQEGTPPPNPMPFCRHPEGLPIPEADDLHVVWLPEGNGVALYESNQILAIIPPWSGSGGFDGYASECIGDGPVAWELSPDNVLLQRFEEAQSYWDKWDDSDLWPSTQASLLSRLEATFGPHSNYYAIDGGNWPPKAIIRIPQKDCVILTTIGVSLRPQPCVEMSTETPEVLRRIELGAVLPAKWSDADIKKFAAYLSAQSTLPWTTYSWLGPGHTIPCDSWRNSNFEFALLMNAHPAIPQVSLGEQFGDPVSLLWFVPLTEAESQTAIDEGSEQVAEHLPRRRWLEA